MYHGGYGNYVPDASNNSAEPDSPLVVVEPSARQTVWIKFNKNTHRQRYDKDSETENEATLVIEPKQA